MLAFVSGFKKFTFKKIVSQNFNQVFIICIWFISLIFESQGGRSTGLINSHVINIGETAGLFFQSLLRFRKFYIFQLCFVVCFALLVAFISYIENCGMNRKNLCLKEYYSGYMLFLLLPA